LPSGLSPQYPYPERSQGGIRKAAKPFIANSCVCQSTLGDFFFEAPPSLR
jgi:hypothetical protein